MTVGELYDRLALMPTDAPVLIASRDVSPEQPWLAPTGVRLDDDRVILTTKRFG